MTIIIYTVITVLFIAVDGVDEMTMSFRPSSVVCLYTVHVTHSNAEHNTINIPHFLPPSLPPFLPPPLPPFLPTSLPPSPLPSSSLLTANSPLSYQMSSGPLKMAHPPFLPPLSTALLKMAPQPFLPPLSTALLKMAHQPFLPPLSTALLKMAPQPFLPPLYPAPALTSRRAWLCSPSSSQQLLSLPSRELTGWPHPPTVTTTPLPSTHPSRPFRASSFMSQQFYSLTQADPATLYISHSMENSLLSSHY